MKRRQRTGEVENGNALLRPLGGKAKKKKKKKNYIASDYNIDSTIDSTYYAILFARNV